MHAHTLDRPPPSAAQSVPPGRPEPALSPALQSYVRDCVMQALHADTADGDAPRYAFHLYLCLGDEDCAATLCDDLRALAQGPQPQGLIALFGQMADGLDAPAALARLMQLMHAHDRRLHLLSPPPQAEDGRLILSLGGQRFKVLSMHGEAHRLCRVMPCPVLVFTPKD